MTALIVALFLVGPVVAIPLLLRQMPQLGAPRAARVLGVGRAATCLTAARGGINPGGLPLPVAPPDVRSPADPSVDQPRASSR